MNGLLSFFLFSPSPQWKPAWVREEDGEVHEAEYRIVNGHAVVRLQTGRFVEGHMDGTTSRKQIAAWWPENPDEIEWRPVEPSGHPRPSVPSVVKNSGA